MLPPPPQQPSIVWPVSIIIIIIVGLVSIIIIIIVWLVSIITIIIIIIIAVKRPSSLASLACGPPYSFFRLNPPPLAVPRARK